MDTPLEIVWTNYLQHRTRMNKPRLLYFEKDDVLHLVISDEPERGSVELNPDITVELNARGGLIGVEILNAGTFIQDSILESVQARVLHC
jgi:uncharacterized protein YuzE